MHESIPVTNVSATADPEVELLARETDTALDTVRELYRAEREKLVSARIKTFIPVLALRRVKELLLVHRRPRRAQGA